jgi:2-C-methyl-D-erythritol 4-phosphate cytidylyltransferase
MDADCGVVIVAAGAGHRMGEGRPKQLRELLGLPLFLWSAKALNSRAEVREIVIVAPEEHADTMRRACVAHNISRLAAVVPGGKLRQDSVRAGVAALSQACALAAVHDAARPFPPPGFGEAVRRARACGAAVLAVPVAETLKRVDGARITGTVDRSAMWAAHTPQVVVRELLLRALDHCVALGIEVTDEGSAIEALGATVEVVESSRTNLKITTAADWALAEAIAESMLRSTQRS